MKRLHRKRRWADALLANSKSSDDDARRDNLKLVYSNLNAHYWDTQKLLVQSYAFYVTISVAVIGFVMTKRVDATGILSAALLISAVELVSFVVWMLRLQWLISLLKHVATELLDGGVLAEFELDTVYKRWRNGHWIVLGIGIALIGTLASGMVWLLLGDRMPERLCWFL